ncbi:hypothetical protein GYH30_032742 [Glycine max]|uniref:Uncharacterized protein n=1 Tax=Glycine max TaxID=3847 RepID=A0A0R0HE47_SOYBN|nr:hypothetical protein GYH30_032742 [Glycine max]
MALNNIHNFCLIQRLTPTLTCKKKKKILHRTRPMFGFKLQKYFCNSNRKLCVPMHEFDKERFVALEVKVLLSSPNFNPNMH